MHFFAATGGESGAWVSEKGTSPGPEGPSEEPVVAYAGLLLNHSRAYKDFWHGRW
ncbi:hypothetical protein Plhal304r1_c022g0078371 [Plasmopara halstedii]